MEGKNVGEKKKKGREAADIVLAKTEGLGRRGKEKGGE